MVRNRKLSGTEGEPKNFLFPIEFTKILPLVIASFFFSRMYSGSFLKDKKRFFWNLGIRNQLILVL
ncbi:hypothetical protein DLM75_21325 [Leptospira stimsonii]|uniref:Uncharacterized protein n=1 Tax=Leptospira stimsonii TaxID=2202203 RepID=A0A396YU99_9LEPT|nr:hypothetical protein DLM75_21325 [Leptospira stimsonii]